MTDSLLEKIERVPLAALQIHPRNPRVGNVEAIAKSLDQNKQFEPLVVQRSTGFVLVGNHRLKAAEYLEWETIDVVYVDVDDDQALNIMLASNRLSDLGHYDSDLLIALLEDRAEAGALEMTGYDADTLDDMIAESERNARAAAEFTAGLGETDDGDGGSRGPGIRGSIGRIREVVLLFDLDNHVRFAEWIETLKSEYGTESQSDVVYEAVKRAAEAA